MPTGGEPSGEKLGGAPMGGAPMGGAQLGGAKLGGAQLGVLSLVPAEGVMPDECGATEAGAEALWAVEMPSVAVDWTPFKATDSTP